MQSHRMTVIGFQTGPEGSVQQRITFRDPVGGYRHKEDRSTALILPPPADGSLGARCLAAWSYFPKEGVVDELALPRNAEVREVEDLNGEWSVGVYAGAVGLFPSNHVRRA